MRWNGVAWYLTKRSTSRTRPPNRPPPFARCAPSSAWPSPVRRWRTDSANCGRSWNSAAPDTWELRTISANALRCQWNAIATSGKPSVSGCWFDRSSFAASRLTPKSSAIFRRWWKRGSRFRSRPNRPRSTSKWSTTCSSVSIRPKVFAVADWCSARW